MLMDSLPSKCLGYIKLIPVFFLLSQLAILNGFNSAQAQSLTTPTGVKASAGLFPDMIEVEWDDVGGGTYEIWRGTENNVSRAALESTVWWNFYMDNDVIPEQVYYYWIRTVSGMQTSEYSASATGYASAGDQSRYTLIINAGEHGKVNKSPDSKDYLTGTYILLMAVPDVGYKFVEWNGSIKSTDNPMNFNISSNMVLNAVFQSLNSSAGSITIYVRPAEVVAAGAKWFIDGESILREPGSTFNTEVFKSYTIKFTFVSGWVTPPDKVIPLAVNMPNISWTCDYTQGAEKFTITIQSDHGVVTKTPDMASYPAGTQVELKAKPEQGYIFSYWAGDLQGSENPAKLTIQGNKVVKAVYVPIVDPGVVKAKQEAAGYTASGTMALSCTLSYPAEKQVLSLKWSPSLPTGWTLKSVSGAGSPEIQQGEIVWTGALIENPIKATATVQVPADQNGPKDISGTVEYQFAGMINPVQTPMDPPVLTVNSITYHAADFRNPRWAMDGTEMNRVLSYWRSTGYHTEPQGSDGYAPGTGTISGSRHSADYKETYGIIDGSEVNRVLAYWRSGSYHVEPQGVDGYAAGTGLTGMKLSVAPAAQITQATQSEYASGQNIVVTNSFEYSGTLLSLLWRPIVPMGWTITQVQGDGSPELQNGEIVWVGLIPTSPIRMNYTIAINPTFQGTANISGEVEYQAQGDINPRTALARPDPLIVDPPGAMPPAIAVHLHAGILIQGQPGKTYRIEASDNVDGPVWNIVGQITAATATETWFDPEPASKGKRFYRVK